MVAIRMVTAALLASACSTKTPAEEACSEWRSEKREWVQSVALECDFNNCPPAPQRPRMCAEDGSVLPDFQPREFTSFLEAIWDGMDSQTQRTLCRYWASGDSRLRAAGDSEVDARINTEVADLTAVAQAHIIIAETKCGSQVSE